MTANTKKSVAPARKVVHDVVASELDWIRLCERLGTEECIMTEMDAQDPEGMTKMELNLRLSLFRQGFAWGVREVAGGHVDPRLTERHQAAMSDADYAQGYSTGSTLAEKALEQYAYALRGGM